MGDQPRWPRGTPVGPGGKGPGGGRWRDGDGPNVPGGGGGGGNWLRRISDAIGRRRRGGGSQEADLDAARQRDIRRRYGLPDDADAETVGTRIRQASTTRTHMRSDETPEQYAERLGAAVAASPYWTPPDDDIIRTPDEIEDMGRYSTPDSWAARVEELLEDSDLQAEIDTGDQQDWPSPDAYVQHLIDSGATEDRREWADRMFGPPLPVGGVSDDPFIAPEGYGDWMGTPEHTEWSNRVSAIMSRPDNHLDPSDLYHEPPTREEYERYKDDPEGFVRDTYDVEVAVGGDISDGASDYDDWAERLMARARGDDDDEDLDEDDSYDPRAIRERTDADMAAREERVSSTLRRMFSVASTQRDQGDAIDVGGLLEGLTDSEILDVWQRARAVAEGPVGAGVLAALDRVIRRRGISTYDGPPPPDWPRE